MVDDFIKRKHGTRKVDYLLPVLKPILEETYGVIVYQEQVMQIANIVAGYSLGEADLLRRAMGKKKVDQMAAHRQKFVDGAQEKGFKDSKKITKIFDLMEQFCRLRVQQVPFGCVRRVGISDGVPQSPLSQLLHGRGPDQ